MRNAPIGHTCPQIDEAINKVDEIIHNLKDVYDSTDGILSNKLSELIKEAYSDLEQMIHSRHGDLEKLRESNSTLRDWGEEQYDEKEALQKENYELQDKCYALESRVTELEKEVEDLAHELHSYD